MAEQLGNHQTSYLLQMDVAHHCFQLQFTGYLYISLHFKKRESCIPKWGF